LDLRNQFSTINIIANTIPNELYYDTSLFIYICHAFLSWGILFYNYFSKKAKIVGTEYIRSENINLIKKIGWILIIIGVAPKLYIDITKLKLFLDGSYINTYSMDLPGALVFMSKLIEYGLIILLIVYRDSKLKVNLIIIIASLLESLAFLSGNRASPVIFLITLFFIKNKVKPNFKFKSLIIYSIIGYFSLIAISTIGEIRGNPYRDSEYIFETLTSYFSFKPLIRILLEFGGTIVTVAYSIQYFPEYGNVQFGFNYLISILYSFPNFGYQSLIYNNISYVNNFPSNARMFLGGSYIGESYYSLNFAAPVIIFLIGIVIAIISTKINYYIANKNWIKVIYLLPFIQSLLWWTRDYFGSSVRDIVWFAFLVFILSQMLKKSNQVNISV
jgi:hypothetical protein